MIPMTEITSKMATAESVAIPGDVDVNQDAEIFFAFFLISVALAVVFGIRCGVFVEIADECRRMFEEDDVSSVVALDMGVSISESDLAEETSFDDGCLKEKDTKDDSSDSNLDAFCEREVANKDGDEFRTDVLELMLSDELDNGSSDGKKTVFSDDNCVGSPGKEAVFCRGKLPVDGAS